MSGTPDSPWGEPGNASLTLAAGQARFGPIEQPERSRAHKSEFRKHYRQAEFCASCHTVIEPHHGLRLEHTFAEWQAGVYAEKGIICQDCHMRPVEQARRTAQTLTPEALTGPAVQDGPERPIGTHHFVGGNVHAGSLAGGERHAEIARQRLQSAAQISISLPEAFTPGAGWEFSVAVTNVGAGHHLPTSLITMRQMWVEVVVRDGAGRELFAGGRLDEHAELPDDALRFGGATCDAQGKLTHKPWEAERFLWQRTIAPKATDRETFAVALPDDVAGPLPFPPSDRNRSTGRPTLPAVRRRPRCPARRCRRPTR